jgi:D-lyxose ketol-isomerase
MKRSHINQIIDEAQGFFVARGFCLPPFAHWPASGWQQPEAAPLRACRLGWDVTDFGSGQFARCGLVLFTLRNGRPGQPGKDYAEKIMMVGEGQVTPTHLHYHKMEDIINRGGGELCVQLWNCQPDYQLANTPVQVAVDEHVAELPAGGILTLRPGQSVTLPPGLYHQFWGQPGSGPVLVGEVSRRNDDQTDNYFHPALPRFPAIEEDVPARYQLVGNS